MGECLPGVQGCGEGGLVDLGYEVGEDGSWVSGEICAQVEGWEVEI